jgi:hydroxymethylpyrimidine/phosphomethylpyrimidine kinase
VHTIVTIAGSDSGAGAGVQADLKTISANGAYGLSILTSVTAQNTREVRTALALPVDLIEAQFASIFDDFEPAAVKTGMLADTERVECVAACLRRYRPPNYVLDPVMISKSGYALLAHEAVAALRHEMLPLADVVTPNVHEAGLLADMEVCTPADARVAGKRILTQGPKAVLVKGGHLEESPATDVLVTADGAREFPGEYIETTSTHGTGCTYSAAIATYLARGCLLEEAVGHAKVYVTEAIRNGLSLGSGAGPTDHFFYLRHGSKAAWLNRPELAGVEAS